MSTPLCGLNNHCYRGWCSATVCGVAMGEVAPYPSRDTGLVIVSGQHRDPHNADQRIASCGLSCLCRCCEGYQYLLAVVFVMIIISRCCRCAEADHGLLCQGG